MKKYTYENLVSDIENLCVKYPIISRGTIGKSLVGRELPLITVGRGKKSLLIVGTHHGMESITSLLCIKYIEEYCRLIEGREKISGISADLIFSERKVYIVPMLNPDGTELHAKGGDSLNPLTERLSAMSGGDYSCWQANGRGVDLNHNYNAGFEEYKKIEPTLGIYGGGATRYSGEYPESEPETSALCAFIKMAEPSMLIALHTQGEEIYADYNGVFPPNGKAIGERLSSLCGYPVSKPEPEACFGGLKDWFILEYNRPAFTIECGKGKNPLPIEDAGHIYSRIRKALLTSPIMF